VAKFTKDTQKYELSMSDGKNITILVTGDWNPNDLEFFHNWLGVLGLSAPNTRLQSDRRVRGRKHARAINPPAAKA
jgi:hypothetical protein